jgi:hypothetical protein
VCIWCGKEFREIVLGIYVTMFIESLDTLKVYSVVHYLLELRSLIHCNCQALEMGGGADCSDTEYLEADTAFIPASAGSPKCLAALIYHSNVSGPVEH